MSKNPHAPQVPRELTRKHLARAERDARATRFLLLGVGGAVVLAVALILFGILRESVLVPNEPVARVGSQTILTRQFQQRVRLERQSLIQQYDFYQSVGLQDNAAQLAQQLADPVGIGSQVVNTLINEAIFRETAPSLGVSLGPDELQKAIEESFNYYRVPPTPAPTDTPAPTATASAVITTTPEPTSTPFPTSTPVSAEGFQQLYSQQLGDLNRYGFNEADYRYFVESQLIANKVQDIVLSDVPTQTEQVQFEYVAAADQEGIDTVQQAITENGWDVVFGQVLSSTFTITNVTGSSVPFVSKTDLSGASQFGPGFADAAFSTPISDTFGVITDTSGTLYLVGRVLNREVRELDSSAFQRAQNTALQKWLTEQRAALNVEVLTWEDRVPRDPAAGSVLP